jgi:hypothetical protein
MNKKTICRVLYFIENHLQKKKHNMIVYKH